MKTFVIYVPGHQKSEEYMQETFASCERMGYDPIPFAGATQHTVKEWIKLFPFMQKDKAYSRLSSFGVNDRHENLYLTKKACLANQVRIWTKCLELDETIVVLEHDARCLRPWDAPEFDEFLILNPESGSHQPVFSYVPKVKFKQGIHTYNQFLTYDYDNSWINAWCPPGLASYAINPSGAKRLLDTVKLHGCEQGDMIINSCTVRLQYAAPDYFSVADNLSMSEGFL